MIDAYDWGKKKKKKKYGEFRIGRFLPPRGRLEALCQVRPTVF